MDNIYFAGPKQEFQSTPSARRATPFCRCAHGSGGISIHALREEGDREYINFMAESEQFQSTPSARRATHFKVKEFACKDDFNPRPPRGGRLWEHWKQFMGEVISIHALREEGD